MKNKRILCLLMALLMLIGGIPLNVLAKEAEPREVNSAVEMAVEDLLDTTNKTLETEDEDLVAEEVLENVEDESSDPQNISEELAAANAAVEALENETNKGKYLEMTLAAKEAVAKLQDSEEKTDLIERIEKEDATIGEVTFYWTLNGEEKKLVAYDGDFRTHPSQLSFVTNPENTIADDIEMTRADIKPSSTNATIKSTGKINKSANFHQYSVKITSENGKKTLSYRVRIEIKNPEKSKDQEIRDIIADLTKHYEGTSEDWSAMAMAFLGHADKVDHDSLISTAQTVVENKNSSTDLERVTISMTSLGYDVTNFPLKDGTVVNIIEEIANFKGGQYGAELGTLNGYIFALLAYDSGSYEVPEGSTWTRDKVIDYILKNQLSDKGWNLYNEGSGDVDITAMTIQALAPYYDRAEVKNAVDDALIFLSNKQVKSGKFAGAYGGFGTTANSNSTAMVIVALNSLGLDSDTDERFIVNDKSALDGLLAFKTADNRFGYTSNTNPNEMATEQSLRAIMSYPDKNAYIYPKPTKVFEGIVLPKSLEFIVKPKSEYFVGDKVDLSGMKIRATMSDNTTRIIDANDVRITGFDTVTSGKKLTKISYIGMDLDFWINVKDPDEIPPVDPETPEQPENPEQPEQPEKPEQPEQPEQPDKPEVPEEPNKDIAYVSVVVPPGPVVYPNGRTMKAKTAYRIVPGKDTAFSMLQKTGLDYNYNYHPVYEGVYVNTIEGLSEFDGGPLSGWMYRVNGKFPDFSSSIKEVYPGDYVEWIYTRDLGKDIGGYVEGVENDDGIQKKEFHVTVRNSEGGKIMPSGKILVTKDKPVTLSFIPDEGYVLFDILVNDKSIGVADKYTLTVENTPKNAIITAVFKKVEDLTEEEKEELENKEDPNASDTPSTIPFVDIRGHWAQSYIEYAYKKGYINGVGSGRFAPDSTLTRGMFVTMLGRMNGVKDQNMSTNFSDVPSDAYYAAHVNWAFEHKIIEGVGNGRFAPEQEITREEMAKMIYHYLDNKNVSLDSGDEIKLPDEAMISPWAKEGIHALYAKGVLNGMPSGEFMPRGKTTRAQVTKVITKMDELTGVKK